MSRDVRSACWAASFLAVAIALGNPVGAGAQVAAPAPDLARTLDAEVRVALFELVEGRDLAALGRLERLASLVEQDSSAAAGPEGAALHFLLAQSYYRLGMLDAFRRSADAALSSGGARYATVLRPQLLLEAYRTGDDARATTLARDLPVDQMSGATALVAGLAAYRAGDLGAARTSFERAIAAGGDDAHYARYMMALTTLRADTTQAATAFESLEAAATGAPQEFADQVRLTAAQVAYEGQRYADAARIAATVDSTGVLAASALLTRAWALYKLGDVAEAERAFSEFAAKYPGRPERDEARIMAAQAQLELGRADEAERLFEQVADSSQADIAALKAETNAAIADVARALVADRLAHMLVPGATATAKTLVLHDSTSAVTSMAVVTGSDLPSGQGATAPAIVPAVATTDAPRRFDSLTTRAPPSVTRVLFAPVSATRHPQELAASTQSLAAADAAVAIARVRLEEQIAAQQREMELLAQLATRLDLDSAAVAAAASDYRAAADSLARLDSAMTAVEARLRELLGREVDATRTIAAENVRTADSLRTALAAGATPEDREALDAEVAAARAYSRIADLAVEGLDNAIARHPTVVMRDSVRAHAARARSVLAELESSYGSSRQAVASALSLLRGGDGPATSAARKALADAEARRASIEGEVVAAVTAELSARAGELVAALQRDMEAAQFGAASATFFRAIDGTRAVGAASAPQRRR